MFISVKVPFMLGKEGLNQELSPIKQARLANYAAVVFYNFLLQDPQSLLQPDEDPTRALLADYRETVNSDSFRKSFIQRLGENMFRTYIPTVQVRLEVAHSLTQALVGFNANSYTGANEADALMHRVHPTLKHDHPNLFGPAQGATYSQVRNYILLNPSRYSNFIKIPPY